MPTARYNLLMFLALAVAMLAGCAARGPAHFQIVGRPAGGKSFVVPMLDADSIGSIYRCERKVHKRNHGHGVGQCEIAPQSVRAGKHMTLARQYADVEITVRAPAPAAKE